MTSKKPTTPDQANAPARDLTAPAPQGAEPRAPRLVSRRALVRAGWAVPVVLALNALPVKAFAASGCTVSHSDNLQIGSNHIDTNACIT